MTSDEVGGGSYEEELSESGAGGSDAVHAGKKPWNDGRQAVSLPFCTREQRVQWLGGGTQEKDSMVAKVWSSYRYDTPCLNASLHMVFQHRLR